MCTPSGNPLKQKRNMADISVPELLSTVTVASATATTLFFICKSRLMRLYSHEKNLIRLQHEQPKSNSRGKILFFSQIGTSKSLALCLCDLFESFRVDLELVDARNYEPEALPKENLVVLVASTSEVWNQLLGQNFIVKNNYPDAAEQFARWIRTNANGRKVGSLVVNACSFSAFVAGKGAPEDDTNLMAKAANHIRDLGDTAELNADFDSWWGSVVAVLQGAILGGAADGMCGESEPEDVGSSDPKRFYLLVEYVYRDLDREHIRKSGLPNSTIKRRMLTITEANFMKNGTVDLEEGGHVTAEWPLRDGQLVDDPLPSEQGICSVGRSCFLAGGNLCRIKPEWYLGLDDPFPARMWCLKYEGSTWIWSFCGIMFCRRSKPLVVPYDGKLYNFGGRSINSDYWVEIYSLKSGLWEIREVPNSALLSGSMDPHSYFLWGDSTKPHKKTHIGLYFFEDNHQWLMSYDVKANNWEYLDCNFPPLSRTCHRKLVRLGCSHYLLIVDSASTWHIYDLSKMNVVETVWVHGLDKTAQVRDIFCCHNTSDESLIYMFMEPASGFEGEPSTYSGIEGIVPYARVKLQLKPFSAKIESKGNFNVGSYVKLYMFAVGDEDQ